MDKNKKGISFEKDANGKNRYVRIDVELYAEELRPLFQKLGVDAKPRDWEEGLNSEEFLSEAKKLLRKKFDERNQIS
jgi:hypothetical protein